MARTASSTLGTPCAAWPMPGGRPGWGCPARPPRPEVNWKRTRDSAAHERTRTATTPEVLGLPLPLALALAPNHHRLAPAPPPVSFLLTYLGNASHPRLFFTGLRWVGTAKRPPPPSARVPRWPGTSPPRSSRLGSSALVAWLFRR